CPRDHPQSRPPARTGAAPAARAGCRSSRRGHRHPARAAGAAPVRAITLNLAHPRGQALLRRLARDADVLVENFRPGTFEHWGLGWDVLSAENPRLVFARVSGWGQDGPYRDRPGFGTMVEAMSGFAAATGPADGPPTLPSFPMAD